MAIQRVTLYFRFARGRFDRSAVAASWLFALLGVLSMGIAASAAAFQPVPVGSGDHVLELGGHFQYLEDPDRSLTILQVVSPDLSDRWTVSEETTLNVGLTDSAIWVRFAVAPASDLSHDRMLEIDFALNDEIEFYRSDLAGGYRVERAGDGVPHSGWSFPTRTPQFALGLSPGVEQTFYMRVVSQDTVLLPMSLASPATLAASEARQLFWFGLFLGGFAVLGLYHLLLFVYLRDITYLYYVAASFGFMGYQAAYAGLVGQFLLPEWIFLKQRFVHLIGACTLVMVYTFAKSFTEIEQRDPSWNFYRRVLTGVLYALIPLALLVPLRWFNSVSIVAAIAGSAQLIIDSWRAWRSGFSPAGYFLVSWIWVGVFGIFFGLRALGAVPDNFVTQYSLQIGSMMSMVSVAFSLSNRITVLQRELEAGMAENQDLLAEVQSLNANLEVRIRERTTELENQALVLAEQSRDLEAASRHKSEFLASMSHELRTPLNAVIGFSEVLVDRSFGELNDKQEQYLGHIHTSGRHLLSLINDILDLAKIEAGRLELEFAEFHLPTAISNSMMLMKERALRGGIDLDSQISDEVGTLVADERKVKQVLINLLSNAVKFTPRGGSVTLAVQHVGENVRISVTDSGIGISPEDQQLVFEEFRQVGTDAHRRAEGTGLGLALSKSLVEAHRGRIWLESTLEVGSRFSFELPIHGKLGDAPGDGSDAQVESE
jgi:signal transduction histidine kinase